MPKEINRGIRKQLLRTGLKLSPLIALGAAATGYLAGENGAFRQHDPFSCAADLPNHKSAIENTQAFIESSKKDLQDYSVIMINGRSEAIECGPQGVLGTAMANVGLQEGTDYQSLALARKEDSQYKDSISLVKEAIARAPRDVLIITHSLGSQAFLEAVRTGEVTAEEFSKVKGVIFSAPAVADPDRYPHKIERLADAFPIVGNLAREMVSDLVHMERRWEHGTAENFYPNGASFDHYAKLLAGKKVIILTYRNDWATPIDQTHRFAETLKARHIDPSTIEEELTSQNAVLVQHPQDGHINFPEDTPSVTNAVEAMIRAINTSSLQTR